MLTERARQTVRFIDDDLLRTVAQLAGARSASISVRGAGGQWCTATVGDVPSAWGLLSTWTAPSSTTPVCAGDGTRIGSLLTFGGPPPSATVTASLRTIARLVAEAMCPTSPADLDAARSVAPNATNELDLAPSFVVVIDATGSLRAVSPHIADVLGHRHEDVVGLGVFSVIHESDHAATIDSLTRMSGIRGERYPTDLRFVRPDGENRVLEVLAIDPADATHPGSGTDAPADIVFLVRETATRDGKDAVVSDQARLLAMIGRGAPVHELLAEAAAFMDAHTPSRSVFLVADERGALHPVPGSRVPEAFTRAMAGEPIRGGTTTTALAAARATATYCADVSVDDGWRQRSAPTVVTGDDRPSATSCWATPVVSNSGSVVFGVLALFGEPGRPINAAEVRLADLAVGLAAVAIERARVELGLVRQAMHDSLTGLPNRALFLDRLTQALAPRPHLRRHTAVMFLDLDRFKVVNDALGHEAGDELLIAVSHRFAAVMRPSETIARFGGDEFTVLCEQLESPRDAMVLAERLVEQLRDPLPLGAGEVTMSVSIGVAVADDAVDASALLRDADAAMYRAKERGRNRVELFDRSMRELALARLELERSFRTSLNRGDFALALQPEYTLRDGRVCGAEALLRWHHPERGLVAPADFIPIAEETGAILALGDWVLEEACRTALVRCTEPGVAESFTTWVNVSVVQLLQPDFEQRVTDIVAASGVSPARIGLEITESAFLTDRTRSIAALTALRERGIRVAIDDFGTGYSSLSYLKALPVDVVKIDRSFVEDVVEDERARSIVLGIVQLARAVGCTTVAEGIETGEQLAVLTDLGCDVGQGFFLARPTRPYSPFPVLGADHAATASLAG